MYWLAEQGLAPKRVFLVIISLLLFAIVDLIIMTIREERRMNNKQNTLDVLNVTRNVLINLSGNIAGGALLANALYIIIIIHLKQYSQSHVLSEY